MPNHVSNSLTVTGYGAEDFLAEVERVLPDRPNFFDHFVPMPTALRTIHTGGTRIDGEYVRAWRRVGDTDVAITPEETAALRAEHGHADWYDWAIEHWGTKWGAYATKVTDGRITFDSAWSPPLAAMEALSRHYPRATFTLAYAERGSDYYGVAVFRNGHCSNTDTVGCTLPDLDWDSPEADEDPQFGFTPAFRAHLEAYGLHAGG